MGSPACPLCAPRRAATALLVIALAAAACTSRPTAGAVGGTASAASRLMPDRARLANASPELRARLVASPIAFFRFVNQAWTREVCEAFARDVRTLPMARLHGDAHVEQYAITATARGLDDFDDSSTGPAVVDIVRFLGSLELTARERGWAASLPSIVDAFLEGYLKALEDPAYLPPDPAVARRLRAAPVRSPHDFLVWADSLMQPLGPDDRARLDAAWARFEVHAVKSDPEFTPAYMARKQAGWLRLGIGSALATKLLVRVEGPSPAFDDDVVVEAKEVAPLRDVPCLNVPRTAEVFRVIEGLHQIGRIEHRLLVALPAPADRPPAARDWWVKMWDRSYRELEIADLASAEELRELALDVGAQLGSTSLEAADRVAGQKRLVESDALARLGPRIRQVAHELTAALLEAWERFRKE